MKKLVKVLPLVLALSAVSSAFAALPSTLKIGTDPTYAPFESKNAKVSWSALISIWPKSCANA
ncbi:Lysine-arginine-ornithine-binding periplasmic protein precursor [Serratia plymuthica]|uniref:Lysine-arginine-ornithine-binding periplasmic protein n=1 Tax=Serratia plymuthica TaxID=82996 RepID=A0A2X4UYH6_SERPL|nr:Lysine-arginine-ornithine-binding periplasmic protein precursor [Serratia plymuthica]SQI43881.1 Lysine-arginine-ornithine-binding periplasmic protein precursor [Serratia plymuthica]